MRIDANVLSCSHKYGIQKVVSLLSSFAYPKDAKIPLIEEDLHAGPCHPSYGTLKMISLYPNYTKYILSSEAYGSAKRQLEILSRSYRKQYGRNFVTLLPTNILGKKEVLRTDGPVVESLIAKAVCAKKSKTPFVCRGSGKPVRQFCYAPGIDISISLTINYPLFSFP